MLLSKQNAFFHIKGRFILNTLIKNPTMDQNTELLSTEKVGVKRRGGGGGGNFAADTMEGKSNM